jgi:hypothetical protein
MRKKEREITCRERQSQSKLWNHLLFKFPKKIASTSIS